MKVLLDSIAIQTYRNFDVVISDDSPDEEVDLLIQKYVTSFPVTYRKNSPAKGSPANWNASIKLAKGEWIKMMHDDDWFADLNCLQKFAETAIQSNGTGFIFSGYNIYEDGKRNATNIVSPSLQNLLRKSPLILFKKNYIGHPSTTMVKNTGELWYDERIKWVVDFEFYIRCLKAIPFTVIREPLVNIGIGQEQITKTVFRNPSVEIPENLYLLRKFGISILRNIFVFDYYWRLLRNLGIRNKQKLEELDGNNQPPGALVSMLNFQKRIPLSFLKIGIVSKLLMSGAFVIFRSTYKIKNNTGYSQ